MKGIFSGLEKLGLGKLEKVEVFEDASKKEEEAKEGKRKSAAVSEADFLFEKTYVCPVCDKEFHSKKIRTGKVKLLAADTDLRPKYQYVDCLKYDAVVCPHCGYAALDRFFKFMMPAQARLIRENISANFKGLPATENIYTYDDAIERHQLALLNTVIKKAKESERAYTCLKMAWIYRGKAESLPEDTQDRKEQIQELQNQEKELLENAYTGFEAAFSKESFPMCGMDQTTVDYLLAVMSKHFKRYDTASKCISRIMSTSSASKKMKDRAYDLKEEIIREIKTSKA